MNSLHGCSEENLNNEQWFFGGFLVFSIESVGNGYIKLNHLCVIICNSLNFILKQAKDTLGVKL